MYVTGIGPAYCPHCFLVVEPEVRRPWPPRLARCPHCRLTIGPGRARHSADDAGPGARGTAAGIYAHEAHARPADPARSTKEAVRAAIRTVAAGAGSQPERLLMVEYQQRAASDDSLPTLSDVFAAFGNWKRARREAALS